MNMAYNKWLKTTPALSRLRVLANCYLPLEKLNAFHNKIQPTRGEAARWPIKR